MKKNKLREIIQYYRNKPIHKCNCPHCVDNFERDIRRWAKKEYEKQLVDHARGKGYGFKDLKTLPKGGYYYGSNFKK